TVLVDHPDVPGGCQGISAIDDVVPDLVDAAVFGHPDVVDGLSHGKPTAPGIGHVDGIALVIDFPGQGDALVLVVGDNQSQGPAEVLRTDEVGGQGSLDPLVLQFSRIEAHNVEPRGSGNGTIQEQVGGIGLVVFKGPFQKVVEQPEVHPGVQGGAGLPFQV